ncbi:hypothetical protein N2152v2_008047, partial [Parachlorella kessleri]
MDPAAEAEALLMSMEQAIAPADGQPAVGLDAQAANGTPAAAAQWGEEQLQQWGTADVKQEDVVKHEPTHQDGGGEPAQLWGAAEVKDEVKEEVKEEAAVAEGEGPPLEQLEHDTEQPRRGRHRHKWGPIPGQEPPAANGQAGPPKRKRRSRWEDTPAEPAAGGEGAGGGADGGVDNSKALMLMPTEVVLSNGYKVVLPPAGRSHRGIWGVYCAMPNPQDAPAPIIAVGALYDGPQTLNPAGGSSPCADGAVPTGDPEVLEFHKEVQYQTKILRPRRCALQVVLPPALTGRSPTGDPEVLEFHKELLELNRKLMRGEIDIPPEGERSPSPPPKYNEFGIRLNTREI